MEAFLDRQSIATIRRFTTRLVILSIGVQVSAGAFSFAGLTSIFSIVCALMALGLNERISMTSINHWDEAVMFLFVHAAAHLLNP